MLGGALASVCALTSTAAGSESAAALTLGAKSWSFVERQSGPVNYYSTVSEAGSTFIRSHYKPPVKKALLGWQAPDREREALKKVRWSWRARILPRGGDECMKGKGDSAAVVYLTWRRGLKFYALKYVWSATGVKGRVCDKKRNLFVAQDTTILVSGGPLNTWRTEELDLRAEFRKHFEKGDPNADVPDFVGLGIMSDGDQTQSESSADFGAFTLSR